MYGVINHIPSNFRLQPFIYIKMLITVLQLIIWHVLIQHFLLEITCIISWSLDCLCVTFSLLLKSIPETAMHMKIHIRHSDIWKIITRAQIPGARLSWLLRFVCWCLMFMGTFFMLCFWCLVLWGWVIGFGKFVHSWIAISSNPLVPDVLDVTAFIIVRLGKTL